MRKAGHFFLALTLLLSVLLQANALELGAPAPEVRARLIDSDIEFQLSQLRGKVVILNFWATWCAPCKAEMPLLQTYYEQHKTEGLEILAISMDDAKDQAAVRRFAQQFQLPLALKADASYSALGRIWRLPTTFVVDRNGILRKNGHLGSAEITAAELDALVTPLLRQ